MDFDDVVPKVGFESEGEDEAVAPRSRSRNRGGAAIAPGKHRTMGAPLLRADSTGPSLLHDDGSNTSSFVDQLLNLQSVLFVIEVKEDDLTPKFRNIRRMDILEEAKKAARRARKAGGSGDSVESGSVASFEEIGRRVPAASGATEVEGQYFVQRGGQYVPVPTPVATGGGATPMSLAPSMQPNFMGARRLPGVPSPSDGMLLQARDLRTLDPKFNHSRDPALLVRRHCIVFSLGSVRALIFSDRVLFFPREGVDGEIQTILQHLQSSTKASSPDGLRGNQEPQPKRGSSDDGDGDGSGAGSDDEEEGGHDSSEDHDLGFELRALEACLVAACDALQKELAGYRQRTAGLFRDLGLTQRAAQVEALNGANSLGGAVAHPSDGGVGGQGDGVLIEQASLTPNKLGGLSDTRRQLRSYLTRITAIAQTLDEMMDDPTDMSQLGVSIQEAATRELRAKEKTLRRLLRGSQPGTPIHGGGRGDGDGDEDPAGAAQQALAEAQQKWAYKAERARQATELLLESYMGEVQGSIIGAKELEGDVAGMEAQAGLMLATKRNLLLRVDLDMSILTAALSAMAAVGGYFGMNLTSGVEEDDHWFWTVLWVSAAVFTIFSIVYTMYVRRLLGGNDT